MARRYGLARVVDSGTALAGPVRPGLAALAGRAIWLYEAPLTGARRTGRRAARPRCAPWPASGARSASPAMSRACSCSPRACARSQRSTTARLERARARAEARTAPPAGRYVFDFRVAPRVETAERRRCRVRDAVLLIGRDPAAWPNAALALAHLPITPGADRVRLVDEDPCEELDGTGARAARYRAELDRGRWRLPDDWPRPRLARAP